MSPTAATPATTIATGRSTAPTATAMATPAEPTVESARAMRVSARGDPSRPRRCAPTASTTTVTGSLTQRTSTAAVSTGFPLVPGVATRAFKSAVTVSAGSAVGTGPRMASVGPTELARAARTRRKTTSTLTAAVRTRSHPVARVFVTRTCRSAATAHVGAAAGMAPRTGSVGPTGQQSRAAQTREPPGTTRTARKLFTPASRYACCSPLL